jgi:hypothetical protein
VVKLGPYLLGPNDTPENGIYCGDARELAKEIPDESVDLIFTDPPYPREFLPLYGWLAEEAARILKPSGFLLVMCGQLYLNQIFRMFDEHLTYFWKYEVGLSGWESGIVWPFGNNSVTIVVRSKPLLAYSKGKVLPRTSTVSLFYGDGGDKRFHKWGQDVVSARYYIDCFSSPGDVVFDSFMGGGTTGAACVVIDRAFLGFDDDMDTVITARGRVRDTQPPLFVPKPQQTEMKI